MENRRIEMAGRIYKSVANTKGIADAAMRKRKAIMSKMWGG